MAKIIRLLGYLLLISVFCVMNIKPAMANGQPDLEPMPR